MAWNIGAAQQGSWDIGAAQAAAGAPPVTGRRIFIVSSWLLALLSAGIVLQHLTRDL